MRIDLCLCGFGNIAKHFITMLAERRETLYTRYGLEFRVVTVAGTNGGIHCPDGFNLQQLIALPKGSSSLQQIAEYWSPDYASVGAITHSSASVLVEATTTEIQTGQPGLSHIKAALMKHMDVVSFSKGPLVKAFDEITKLAKSQSCRIKYSGATAAALPTVDVGYYCLAGDDILGFEGILNGTTNYILTRMTQDNLDYQAALAEAITKGIAEPNPSLDVEGWDTASKLIIIANTLFSAGLTLDTLTVEGIQGITVAAMKKAQQNQQVIKLVGEVHRCASGLEATVSPKLLSVTHPLFSVNGTNKGIVFTTGNMGTVSVLGGGSDPRGTAAAALKDLINIARERNHCNNA